MLDSSQQKTIIFIHGAWVTPKCWEKFIDYFEEKGYNCLAPAWPYKDREISELQNNPDKRLGKLGISEIVDHYQTMIERMDNRPILIGHSFGGLFVQILLDRGFGELGIAIDSAPPKGILPFYWSTIKSLFGVLKNPRNSNRLVSISLKEFQYSFVHLLSEEDQKEVYNTYVIPESGKIFFQSAFAQFNNASKVNFKNNKRSPLLLIGGLKDNIVPAKINRKNYKKYKKSTAITEHVEFEDRCHWIIAQDGWDEISNYINNWINKIMS